MAREQTDEQDRREELMSSEYPETGRAGTFAPGETQPAAPPDQMGSSQSHDALKRHRRSPVLAGFLSLLPGLGQIYVGHYQRGFGHIVVVSAIIALLSSSLVTEQSALAPLLGIFLAFFWLYNIIDAIRLATFYNDALAGARPEDLRKYMILPGRGGSLAGGLILFLFGFLLLLHTMFDVSMEWLESWWPVLPMAFGVYLIYKGIQDRRREPE
jgi:hypothetical protein